MPANEREIGVVGGRARSGQEYGLTHSLSPACTTPQFSGGRLAANLASGGKLWLAAT